KALELALERARYEANRARRQFDAVEPENRLVASELENRWNNALAQVAELEARLAGIEEKPEALTEQQEKELLALSEELPALWNHPEAPVQLKKRILRTVLVEIIIGPGRGIICTSYSPALGRWRSYRVASAPQQNRATWA